MCFWGDMRGGNEQARCSTWTQAEAQHAAMVEYAKSPAAVWGFIKDAVRVSPRLAWDDLKTAVRDASLREPSEYERLIGRLDIRGGADLP